MKYYQPTLGVLFTFVFVPRHDAVSQTSDGNEGNFIPCRVLVIGSTGSGKSTLISALAGTQLAETSADAQGCTASYSSFFHTRRGNLYEFIDTVGLNEVDSGKVNQIDAMKMFFGFLKENSAGFNLIIFCTREERLTAQAKATYQVMVKDLYSQAKVDPPPVLIVVGGTFLAQADPQDWCVKNRHFFVKEGYEEATDTLDQFHCISLPDTSPNPRLESVYEKIRADSTSRAWKLIDTFVTPECRPFYKGHRGLMSLGVSLWNRFVDISDTLGLKQVFGFSKAIPEVLWKIVKDLGLSKDVAAELYEEGAL
jgi:energy-coupling factor transporter ATP-binding protein EcfA2